MYWSMYSCAFFTKFTNISYNTFHSCASFKHIRLWQIYIVIPVYARKCTWFNVWYTTNLYVEFCNFLAYAESIGKKNVVLFSMRYRLGQLIWAEFFFLIIILLIYIYIHCPIFITVTCYLLKIEINKNHVHYTRYKDVTWK